MTNPKNKKTHEQFVSEISQTLEITLLEKYANTDTKIKYSCKHGTFSAYPWALLKRKFCCRDGFYKSGKMWESNTKTLSVLKEQALKDRQNVDVSSAYVDDTGKYKKLANIKCTIHNLFYSSITGKKIGICPTCRYEQNMKKLSIAQEKAWKTVKTGVFVSDPETKWLDSLGVPYRQYWLSDVKYKVDGFDPETNTVYLYHGKFWHGCPQTYDENMIHPIRKIPMKQLYEKTIEYENKIKQAGYNLIVKWGT